MRVILITILMAIFSANAHALTLRDGDVYHDGKTYFCASPQTELAIFTQAHAKEDYAGVVNRCFYYIWNQYIFYVPFKKFIHKHKTDRIEYIKETLAARITLVQNQTASIGTDFFSYQQTLPSEVRFMPAVVENLTDVNFDESLVYIGRVLDTVQDVLNSDDFSIDDIELPDDLTDEELAIVEDIVERAIDGDSILKEIEEIATANGAGELAGGAEFDEALKDFAEEVIGDVGIDKVADETLGELDEVLDQRAKHADAYDTRDIKEEDK